MRIKYAEKKYIRMVRISIYLITFLKLMYPICKKNMSKLRERFCSLRLASFNNIFFPS